VVVFLEPDGKLPGGVYVQSGEEELVSPRYPRGRILLESFPIGILSYGHQYLLDDTLDPSPVYPAFRGKGPLQTFEASSRQLHGKGEWLVGCSSPVS